MPDICCYFQVHQPLRIKPFSYFAASKDQDYFDKQGKDIAKLPFNPGQTYLYLYHNIPQNDLELLFEPVPAPVLPARLKQRCIALKSQMPMAIILPLSPGITATMQKKYEKINTISIPMK